MNTIKEENLAIDALKNNPPGDPYVRNIITVSRSLISFMIFPPAVTRNTLMAPSEIGSKNLAICTFTAIKPTIYREKSHKAVYRPCDF